MNYTTLKKYTEAKLTSLKEALVRTVNLPENTISHTCKNGSYVINPFGADSYSFDVIFSDKDNFENFIKKFSKTDIYNEVEADTNVSDDGIHNHFVVTGFVNKALLNDIQMVFRDILKNDTSKQNDMKDVAITELGDMK